MQALDVVERIRTMKKMFAIILVCIMTLGLCSCSGGGAFNVSIKENESALYTTKEINSAINVAIKYFERNFSGCTLTEITYAGDKITEEEKAFADQHNADEVIVLISSFDVDSSGGDGSLEPNSTYTDWKWILVRNNGGKWRHVDHGNA